MAFENKMNEIIALIILCIPLIWELIDDKKGDLHPNKDWVIRGGLMLITSALTLLFVDRGFLQAFGMSFGIFVLFFPYLYNIFNKKKPWYNYLSLTAFPDKLTIWRMTPWSVRMGILGIIFGIGLSFYFWEEIMAINYPYGR